MKEIKLRFALRKVKLTVEAIVRSKVGSGSVRSLDSTSSCYIKYVA